MHNQNIIIYVGGCYGTFFEWFLNYLNKPDLPLPFTKTGSSHLFQGNFLQPKEKLFEYIQTGEKNLYNRVHFGLFETVNKHEMVFSDDYASIMQKDIDYLSQHFDKILLLNFDNDSILWCENNQLDKVYIDENVYKSRYEQYGYTRQSLENSMTRDPILKLKYLIDKEIKSQASPLKVSNLQGWNKSNIHDFDIWQLRELLSYYWFTRVAGQITAFDINKSNNSDFLFVSITDLRNNFVKVLVDTARYFGHRDTQKITELAEKIYDPWKNSQKQIDKDFVCKKIVDHLISQQELDWTNCNLSIIDEAWIQLKLRENKIEIKCDGLDVWPTTTKDFFPLLYKI